MPKSFVYPREGDFPYAEPAVQRTDIWIPVALTGKKKTNRVDADTGTVVGRLRPGVTLRQAQDEMRVIESRLEPLFPADLRGWTAAVDWFIDSSVRPVRPLLWLLFGAVLLVLLIACSNVANLLAARAAGRVHEMGVRTALGAARGRLIRQMLTEALLLVICSGVLGVLMAVAVIRSVTILNPGRIPRLAEASVDGGVLLFTFVTTVLTAVLCGLWPALTSSQVKVSDMLKAGGRRGIAGVSNRLRDCLIVFEVAMAVVLLAGAGLLLRSYLMVLTVDAGFSRSTITIAVPLDERYQTPPTRVSFYQDLLTRIRALPGIQSAGAVESLPLSREEDIALFEVKGRPVKKIEAVDSRQATADYPEAMGIRILEGRFIRDDDVKERPAIAVISRRLAQVYFPDGQAIGQQIRFGDAKEPWNTIVGIVSDVRNSSLEETPRPVVYRSWWQHPSNGPDLAIRALLPLEQVVSSVRAAVRSIDPALAIQDARTMSQLVAEASARRRFQTVVLVVFAGIALSLAMVGLYALLSYAVKQRTPEIGIRMALGATRAGVLGLVLRQGLLLAGGGVVLGLSGALALTRAIASMLYVVKPADPLTFTVVPLLLLLTAVGACVAPAWRATQIDPITALRQE